MKFDTAFVLNIEVAPLYPLKRPHDVRTRISQTEESIIAMEAWKHILITTGMILLSKTLYGMTSYMFRHIEE